MDTARRAARDKKDRRHNDGEFLTIVRLFDAVAEAGNRYPKIRIVWRAEGDYDMVVLSRAGKRARYPGSINLTDGGHYPDNQWYGRIMSTGTYNPTRPTHEFAGRIYAKLALFNEDPIAFAKAEGALIGNCMFCGLELTNQDSIARGYGPQCAANWGLPKGGLTLDRKVEVKSPETCERCGHPPDDHGVCPCEYARFIASH